MYEIVNFLKLRRSTTAKNMLDGLVVEEDLSEIINCGIRVPDHAALNPWKIVIIKGQKRNELGLNILEPEFKKNNPKANKEDVLYERNRFLRANVILSVISSPVEHPKIPKWEMYLSAGVERRCICRLNMRF